MWGIDMNQVFTIVGLVLTGLVLTTAQQKAFATNDNQLIFQPNHSWRWNSGYSQGYKSIPAIGNHTQEFWSGYRNGTEEFQWAKGYSEAASNLTKSEHTPMYLDGYHAGTFHRSVTQAPLGALPANTTDHYRQYYIGGINGVILADKDYGGLTLTVQQITPRNIV
jgi:hypothetical protein